MHSGIFRHFSWVSEAKKRPIVFARLLDGVWGVFEFGI